MEEGSIWTVLYIQTEKRFNRNRINMLGSPEDVTESGVRMSSELGVAWRMVLLGRKRGKGEG